MAARRYVALFAAGCACPGGEGWADGACHPLLKEGGGDVVAVCEGYVESDTYAGSDDYLLCDEAADPDACPSLEEVDVRALVEARFGEDPPEAYCSWNSYDPVCGPEARDGCCYVVSVDTECPHGD
ncbi:MAG: hypothetical protein ACOZNI_17320 [Myxococcota bacterium]